MEKSEIEKLKGILKTLSAQEYTLKLGGVFDLTKSYEFFFEMVNKFDSGEWTLNKSPKKEPKSLDIVPPLPKVETSKDRGRPKGSKNKSKEPPKWDLRNGN